MIRRSIRATLILAAIICMLATARPAAADRAGTVVAIGGSCFLEREGAHVALAMGQAVQVGDMVEVTENAKLKLRMTDGSIVALAANTRLKIRSYRLNASGQRLEGKLDMSSGLLRAIVTPTASALQNFDVNTAVGTVAVRSTDWFVEALPGADQVGVLKGSVLLTSAATGRSEIVPAGWGARLEAGRDPVPARVWFSSEFQSLIDRTQ